MKLLNLSFLCEFGAELGDLTKVTRDSSPVDVFGLALRAQFSIDRLIDDYSLEVCSREAQALCRRLRLYVGKVRAWGKLVQQKSEDADKEWEECRSEIETIAASAKRLHTLVLEEIDTVRAYMVEQKGIYDTTALIERAERSLPESAIAKMPEEAVRDMKESGKCLAFECPTAAGFHILRAAEVVLHLYHTECCKPSSTGKLKSWGAYIKALREHGTAACIEVASLIQQIKDLDRNPIMHPDEFLSADEAFALFELAKSAIILMAAALPPIVPPTAAPAKSP